MRDSLKLITALLLVCSSAKAQEDYKSFPMWNPSLPIEIRVNDVVSRLTLEEKVSAIGAAGIRDLLTEMDLQDPKFGRHFRAF